MMRWYQGLDRQKWRSVGGSQHHYFIVWGGRSTSSFSQCQAVNQHQPVCVRGSLVCFKIFIQCCVSVTHCFGAIEQVEVQVDYTKWKKRLNIKVVLLWPTQCTQQTDPREVRPLKVRGWATGWEQRRGRGAKGFGCPSPWSPSLVGSLGAIRCSSCRQLKWRLAASAVSCRRAGDVVILRGVNHRRLREVTWVAVCWDSPLPGCRDDTTVNLRSVHACEQTYTGRRRQTERTPLRHERKMMAWMMYCTVTHYKHSHTHIYRRCRAKTGVIKWLL